MLSAILGVSANSKLIARNKQKKMKRTTIIIFCSLLTAATFGQKTKIDSVQALIKQDSNDTIKVAHLNYLASLYSNQKKFKAMERVIA